MSIYSDFKVINLIILDFLSSNEFQSSLKLHEDLKYKAYLDNTLLVEYKKINTSDDLYNVLNWVKIQIQNKVFFPLLHFDAHGNADGLKISENSRILWKELLLQLKEINTLLLNNLTIIMSVCKGATLLYKIDYYDRAPFNLIIGPEFDLKVGELYQGFFDFYDNLFFKYDFNEAYIMMSQNIKTISDKLTMVRVDTCFDIYTSFNEKSENFEEIIEPYRLIYLNHHPGIRFETLDFQRKESMRALRIVLDNLIKNKYYFMMEDLIGTSPASKHSRQAMDYF